MNIHNRSLSAIRMSTGIGGLDEVIDVRLYLAGESSNSVTALANLRDALHPRPEPRVDVEIIDVLNDPTRGLRDGIVVTPMLVKVAPRPERRILRNLRDLRDRRILLSILGLDKERHG